MSEPTVEQLKQRIKELEADNQELRFRLQDRIDVVAHLQREWYESHGLAHVWRSCEAVSEDVVADGEYDLISLE
jgi:hypothetical protein